MMQRQVQDPADAAREAEWANRLRLRGLADTRLTPEQISAEAALLKAQPDPSLEGKELLAKYPAYPEVLDFFLSKTKRGHVDEFTSRLYDKVLRRHDGDPGVLSEILTRYESAISDFRN